MPIKIGSLNLCLGLPNKKDLVKKLILDNEIDILCLQETELDVNLDHGLMSFKNYNYESEINDTRSRVGTLISSGLDYIRRRDLEGINNHLIVIDVRSSKSFRLINVYRPFNPRNNVHPRVFFENQLKIIKTACTKNTVLLGDLNLDWFKKELRQYAFRAYFDDFERVLSGTDLVQMVNFPTWSRTINGVVKESLLDHFYSNNPLSISDIHPVEPIFGDHCMIVASICTVKPPPSFCYRRNWSSYDRSTLCENLALVDWHCDYDDVQSYWNNFENKLLAVIDNLVPLTSFSNHITTKQTLPASIKSKINLRKRLIASFRSSKCAVTKTRLSVVNKEIKSYFKNIRSNKVRKTIIPGNTKSLWKAVRLAKDQNTANLPKSMLSEGTEIESGRLADEFACFFDKKIRNIVDHVVVDSDVYNGVKKLDGTISMFMDPVSIKECVLTLKSKNTEGLDRIPQRILLDGVDELIIPMSNLFRLIYRDKSVPDQWLIAKTIPVFKNKGNINHIENYRPIANLCSTSKVFEKLILKRILKLQDQCQIDLTGANQHGFKKNHSTSTLTAKIQSLIARALDDDECVLLTSLDLSAAFDLVDINLLIKRLKIVGLPQDVIDLISIWLQNRSFYICIDDHVSIMYDLLLGTVQGSILGPILYAIFVSPLFDICDLNSFADDIYITKWSKNVQELTMDMEREIVKITKWLKQSGLKVNDEKTDICIFNKHNIDPLTIRVNGFDIVTKNSINVLGVLFESKLNWSAHIVKVINKANKALNAIKLIRKFFNTSELINIVTSNFYSILFYNSEIWHLPTLDKTSKHSLFAASANALKMCHHYPSELISYYNFHKMSKRATPEMLCNYKLSLSLYKTFNNACPYDEWIFLNFDQICTSRQLMFMTKRANKSRVGMNCLTNRFFHLNNRIPLSWLNKSYNSYKIECKKLFLTFH